MSSYYNKKELEEFLVGNKPYIQEYSKKEPEQKVYDWIPWIGKTLKLLPETEFYPKQNFYKMFFDKEGKPLVFKVGDFVYSRDEIHSYIKGDRKEKPRKYRIYESWICSGRWVINVMFNGSKVDSRGNRYKTLYPITAIPEERYMMYLSEHPEYKNVKREVFRLNILLEEE